MTELIELPPHSLEAEQAVLGALMLSNESWDRIGDIIGEADFYRADHQAIYRQLCRMIEANRPADVLTVGEALRAEAAQVDLAYLAELANAVASAANIRRYAEIVRDKSTLRKTLAAAEEIRAACHRQDGRTAGQVLDEAQAKVLALGDEDRRLKSSAQAFGKVMGEVFQMIDERARNPGALLGVSTGFVDLDGKTEGLQPGDLIIVAGRPSMGKTSFAMNIAESVVMTGRAGLVFSMEMNATQIVQRSLSSTGRIPLQRLRSGRIDQREWDKLNDAAAKLHDAPFFIDDSPALSVSEVRARARRIHRQMKGLGIIVVDYLQLMKTAGNSDNRATELGEVSRGLKGLARELNCPVVALSQLNRSLEQRPNKRPIMSDLRESGALEQDADLILFVYRDEVYHEESPAKGTAEIIIGKQRNGALGTVTLTFLGELTKFENFSGEIRYDTGPRVVRRHQFEVV